MTTAVATHDLVIVGSGAAGLVAALTAAVAGARVLVLEASSQLGGTTAISGGNVWVPANSVMRGRGFADDLDAALVYLRRVTRGLVSSEKLTALLFSGPEMVDFIQAQSRIAFVTIERPDYHPDWPGAAAHRGLEVEPIRTAFTGSLRKSPIRAPVTYGESRRGIAPEIVQQRRAEGFVAQGAGLVAGLVEACDQRGVQFRPNARAVSLTMDKERVVGVRLIDGELISAPAGVFMASGGFEWNESLQRAFLPGPPSAPITQPWARGDGLLMGMAAGAAIDNMTESWWTAAIRLPDECYDGHAMTRNLVRDLALPGSVLVNSAGRRFVNEASGYNELGKAFLHFDPQKGAYVNSKAWLVFDEKFRSRYGAATARPDEPIPAHVVVGATCKELASTVGIDLAGLLDTLRGFNTAAMLGYDDAFGRGSNAHDRFNGDADHAPNPCLGDIATPPFYAVEVQLGNNGTKGGLVTDLHGRVLSQVGQVIAGLYACGDVSASPMGPGYPGSGGSLGPSMAMSYRAAQMATCDAPTAPIASGLQTRGP